ncbi:MAG: 50S ribosomal protein L29 [Bacteroidetes bacterium]|nr:50S ribosomal protein L29 [Bacteroidota bacterium]
MKQSQINELTLTEIKDMILEESVSLSKMQFNHAVSPLENPMQLRASRKTIARLKTALKNKESQTSASNN